MTMWAKTKQDSFGRSEAERRSYQGLNEKGSVPHIYHGAERTICKRLFSGWNENVAGRDLEMDSRTVEDRNRHASQTGFEMPAKQVEPNRINSSLCKCAELTFLGL